jgi:hypothetical protein
VIGGGGGGGGGGGDDGGGGSSIRLLLAARQNRSVSYIQRALPPPFFSPWLLSWSVCKGHKHRRRTRTPIVNL